MIRILFFAQIKEVIGVGEYQVSGDFKTAAQLRDHLATLGDKWALALQEGKLLMAINQTLSEWDAPISDGDEVAFFPPVTGG
jgi:molybdopterin synthase sulfur carrier subunit